MGGSLVGQFRRRTRTWVVVLVAVIAAGACGGGGGGGGDDTKAADSSRDAAASTTTAKAAGAVAAAEVPKFIGDFERVCTTQVGFGGVAAYEEAPGVHPVVFFEDFRGEGFVHSSRELPAGWSVTQDENFEDSSELKAAQLVACSDRVAESPTGIRCEFDDNKDGGKVELELVDATYQLKVYAASTGELQHEQTLEAKATKCPFIAAFRKGDTTFVHQPSDDDYTAALKAVVAP